MDPLFNMLPNEMLRQILGNVSPQQRLSVQRTSVLWSYLTRSFPGSSSLKSLKEEFPYLITNETLLATDFECVELLEKQRKIYTVLAKAFELSVEDLLKIDLVAFSNLNTKQKTFLKNLAVASNLEEDAESENKREIFELMAEIGNTQKLEKWIQKYKENILKGDKELALARAAKNGHLKCVQLLMNMCGEEISAYCKGMAFRWAAEEGRLDCVTYLIQTCGQVISEEDREKACELASKNDHDAVVQELYRTLNGVTLNRK